MPSIIVCNLNQFSDTVYTTSFLLFLCIVHKFYCTHLSNLSAQPCTEYNIKTSRNSYWFLLNVFLSPKLAEVVGVTMLEHLQNEDTEFLPFIQIYFFSGFIRGWTCVI